MHKNFCAQDKPSVDGFWANGSACIYSDNHVYAALLGRERKASAIVAVSA